MDTTRIQKKLAGIRGQIRFVLGLNALLMLLAVSGVLVAGSYALDWLFQLPWGARAVMLLLMFGAMAWGALRFFLRPLSVPMSPDALALLVEHRHPEYDEELISALQLARDLESGKSNESPAMMQAVIGSALQRFENESFSDAVNKRFLIPHVFMSLAAVILIASWGFAVPDHASLWFRRCVLLHEVEWPPRTRLDVRIANLEKFHYQVDDDGMTTVYVPENSALRVEVKAEGDIPSTVQIRKFGYPREDHPNPITIEMPGRAGSSAFEYKFGRVSQSFEFYVEGGDDDDERPYFRVLVRAAPRINDLEVDYDYPDYINDTGEQDRIGVKEYNVVGPVGTRVTMKFTTSTRLNSFELVLDDDEHGTERLNPAPENPYLYIKEFVLESDHFYTYRLVGANDAPSREAPNFNISAQPDLPPQLGIYLPEVGTVDVSAKAVVPLKFQVSDDWQVGEVVWRWDTTREGAFAQRQVLEGDDLREIVAGGREISAFEALDMGELEIVDEGAKRPLRAGDTVFIRLEASDTRVTEKAPDPNSSTYPSLVVLHVREPAEIERELMRSQVRLKDQVKRVEESARLRLEEIRTARGRTAKRASEREDYEATLYGLVSAQDLVTSSLSESARGFVRVFNGHLFNRLDASNLTETLIAGLCADHRTKDGTHYEFLSTLLPKVRSQIDESEAMGKLTRIMDLLLDSADAMSPEVSRALKKAVDVKSPADTERELATAEKAAKELHDQLLVLVDKMEEWEDFQDVIQSLQDIIELEKGLWSRMKKIAK